MAKSKPCADCGVTFPPYVMDLDHVRGDKAFAVSKAAAGTIPLERVLEEINKCDVVCSNCHRIRTFKRGWPGYKNLYAGRTSNDRVRGTLVVPAR